MVGGTTAETGMPVLGADGIIRFSDPALFRQAVAAVTAREWLWVRPEVEVKTGKAFPVVLRYDAREMSLRATALAVNRRGPFLALMVEPAGPMTKGTAGELPAQPVPLADPAPPSPAAMPPVPPPEPQAGEEAFDEEKTAPEAEPLPAAAEPPRPQPAAAPQIPDPMPQAAPAAQPPPEPEAQHPAPQAVPLPQAAPAPQAVPLPQAAPAPQAAPVPQAPDPMPAQPPAAAAAPPPAGEGAAPGEQNAPPAEGGAAAAQPQAKAPAIPPLGAAFPALSGTAYCGFNVKELAGPFPTRGHSLPLPEKHALYRVLGALAIEAAVGTVEVKSGERTARIYMSGPKMIAIDPLDVKFDDYLAKYLIKEQVCDEGKVEKARTHAAQTQKALAVSLIETKALIPAALAPELRKAKEEAFGAVLSLPREVSYTYTPGMQPRHPIDPMALPVVPMLVKHVRKTIGTVFIAEVEPILGHSKFKFLQAIEGPRMFTESLGLSDKERQAMESVLDGQYRLSEVYPICVLSKHGTTRLVVLLWHYGLLRWSDEPLKIVAKETVEEMLTRICTGMKGADLFSRLSLHWTVHPSRIEAAYQELKKQYGPGCSYAAAGPKEGAVCADIWALIEEAYATLSVRARRRQYRLDLHGQVKVFHTAEFIAQQADMVRFRVEWEKAFELMESAIDIMDSATLRGKLELWKQEKAKGGG